MKLSLSHHVAELIDNHDSIITYGNYSIIKKNANLPRHIANTMDLNAFVLLVMREGEWVDMGEMCGFKVYKVNFGKERVYVACHLEENRIQYIVGLEDF